MRTTKTATAGAKGTRSARAAAVKAVEGRIADALASFGFKQVRKGRYLKLVKQVGDDFEICVSPGVSRRSGKIEVDPVIMLICVPLQRELEKLKPLPTVQVCHSSLGTIDQNNLWIYLELVGETIGEDGLAIITQTLETVALPLLTSLCSLENVREFFEQAVDFLGRPIGVAVLQAHLKLTVLNELLKAKTRDA